MDDFPNCITQAELIQVPVTGMHFTWHNGRQGEDTILRKLGWAWGNQNLLATWPLMKTNFQAKLVSYQNPIILTLSPPLPIKSLGSKF